MITDLHTQIKVFIQTRNGDLNNISMKDVAEIIHTNVGQQPEQIGDQVKMMSKFVQRKRQSGELDLDKDCITYPLLQELQQSIKAKFRKKTIIIEDFVTHLSYHLPDHVKRKKFNQNDPFSDEFNRQVHLRPTNGSEKLKSKMERMWVTTVVTEKLLKQKEDYLFQSAKFDR